MNPLSLSWEAHGQGAPTLLLFVPSERLPKVV
jgi:hypothetical protein